jgi:pimeloyl-ACP methyl ester carboxylesterase
MRLALALLVPLSMSSTACSKKIDAAPAHVEAFAPTAFVADVRGAGRPVILIPGLGCPSSVWDGTVEHLVGAGYQTHALTLSGFAGRPRIDKPLAETATEEIAQYIADRKLDHPIIIGHSMGGYIAYWLAEKSPDLVGPTIVVDQGTGLGGEDKDANAAQGAQIRAMWSGASDEQYAAQVRDVFGGMAAHPTKLSPLLPAITRSDRGALGDAIAEMYAHDLGADAKTIKAPVLAVLADGSLKDTYRRQVDPIPDHAVVTIPASGHFVMLDDPTAFDAAIDKFLASHPADTRAASL